MKNHEKLINFCKENNKAAKILGVPTDLIKLMKSIDKKCGIEEAVFLSQIIYWSDRSKRDDGYFYKSDKEWEIELGLSRYKLDRMREIFCKLGFIKIKKVKANGAPTRHYRVNIKKIQNDLSLFYQLEELIDNSVAKDIVLKNKQMELKNSHNSNMRETDNFELQENNNSLTESTHKLPHKIEQKAAALNCDTINILPRSTEFLSDEELEFKEKMFEIMVEEINDVFPDEELETEVLDKIRSVAYSVNCYCDTSDKFSPEKPDHYFIYQKLRWARNTRKNDDTFTLQNLITALTKPENLAKYRNWEKKNWKYRSEMYQQYRSPLDYCLLHDN